MANINDSYFDGHYKDIWRTVIPEELTVKEVEFMVPYFKLEPGQKVLDLMCGYGRHAIGLAKKGLEVTAVDNLTHYIDEINDSAARENVKVNAVKADVINYKPAVEFDLAMCMGNSFNFFDKTDAVKLLTTVSSSLKKGGHLLINSWSIAEIAFKNFKEKSWSYVGELKFLTEAKFLFYPTRIETESIILSPDGKAETKTGIDYIYSINEMEAMLKEAGLILTEVYSIPGRKTFAIGEPRAYLVAEKK
jgi:SAM-dependent methyltransferase